MSPETLRTELSRVTNPTVYEAARAIQKQILRYAIQRQCDEGAHCITPGLTARIRMQRESIAEEIVHLMKHLGLELSDVVAGEARILELHARLDKWVGL